LTEKTQGEPNDRDFEKIGVPDLALMKQRGERIVMLTAYDARWRGCSIKPASICCLSEIRLATSFSAWVRQSL